MIAIIPPEHADKLYDRLWNEGRHIGFEYAYEGNRCIGMGWGAYKLDGNLYIVEAKNERRPQMTIKLVDY